MKDGLRMSDGNDDSRRPGPAGVSYPDLVQGGGPASSVDETVQIEIGVRLKAYYDTITREPVPDRFMELLGQLDNVDAPKGQRANYADED